MYRNAHDFDDARKPSFFKVGDYVYTHPGTDRWMMGVQSGRVVATGPKWVTIESHGRKWKFAASLVSPSIK